MEINLRRDYNWEGAIRGLQEPALVFWDWFTGDKRALDTTFYRAVEELPGKAIKKVSEEYQKFFGKIHERLTEYPFSEEAILAFREETYELAELLSIPYRVMYDIVSQKGLKRRFEEMVDDNQVRIEREFRKELEERPMDMLAYTESIINPERAAKAKFWEEIGVASYKWPITGLIPPNPDAIRYPIKGEIRKYREYPDAAGDIELVKLITGGQLGPEQAEKALSILRERQKQWELPFAKGEEIMDPARELAKKKPCLGTFVLMNGRGNGRIAG